MMDIVEKLFEMQDKKYAIFTKKLIPNVDINIIGVRMPYIRKIEKNMSILEKEEFLKKLPHKYHEENLLHSIILSSMKDYDKLIKNIDVFLPYINNWSVNDTLSPKIFKKNTDKLLEKIKVWIKSKDTYTVRFAITTLIYYYLDDEFKKEHIYIVSSIKTEDYYINMAIAWYMSTAVIKQYDVAIRVIENKIMEKFVHNKSIQKAVESYRISDEKKEYLRTLRK